MQEVKQYLMLSDDNQSQVFKHREGVVESHEYKLEWSEQGSHCKLSFKGKELLEITAANYFALSDLMMVMDVAERNLMCGRTILSMDDVLVRSKKK